jgi:hypothetical protein
VLIADAGETDIGVKVLGGREVASSPVQVAAANDLDVLP